MSVITGIIPKQHFEYVHDRIGEILVDELDNQFVISYNTDLEVTVYKERHIPFNHQELPAVNVLLWKGDFSQQTQVEKQGLYRFIIECIGKASNEDSDNINDKRGDTLSMTRIQRLMGVIAAILDNPKYKTLGFTPPYIGYRRIEEMYFMKTAHQDADNTMIGRLILAVQVNETYELISPTLIGGHDTEVRLAETDRGFIWTLEAE